MKIPRRQETGDRRQEEPEGPPPPDRRSLGEGGWRQRAGSAAFFWIFRSP